MMKTTCQHSYVPLKNIEKRMRCIYCNEIIFTPDPGDSYEDLVNRINETADDPSVSDEDWVGMVAEFMRKEYEYETGLPFFEGSKDYIDWLNSRLSQRS